MYLCVCNDVTKEQVIIDIKKGLTEQEIIEKRGVTDNCRACESSFEELVTNLPKV
jgi:bacterioferritin-associated ferredoxin